MAWQQRDYYALLGVGREASAAEIDRAYRRAARATHPDLHPDDDSAADRFRALAIAHETLRNPERRDSYDRAHPGSRPPVRPARLRPARPARVVIHQRSQPTLPAVELGRRRPQPELVTPFRAGLTATPDVGDELLWLVTAFSRLLGDWPFGFDGSRQESR